MENDEFDNTNATGTLTNDIDSQCAINSAILDYYKKFGRKRDLEQFFSLSTAQGDISDISGLFWRKMKSENDSSDSGGRKSDSSAHELCRISIRCSVPEGSTSQSDDPKTKTESPHTESPPIITDDVPANISRHTDDDSLRSDDNHSQKSYDPLLDLSTHKPLSPTSSITSQRKLEWDSLADVGYANETDRKTSASSLSTLERLALKQQYSNNDSNNEIGQPTCHSTPVEENASKYKMKKNVARKVTKVTKKDVDFLELNVPHTKDAPHQSINVNLTKHISFNIEKDGGISFENIRNDVDVSPDKQNINLGETSRLPTDKEIQTSLPKTKDKSCNSVQELKATDPINKKIPVMISLNTLRKRLRKRKSTVVKRRIKTKRKNNQIRDNPAQEKSGEQLSAAESFEYMPGHIYNQNQINNNGDNEQGREHNNTAGNKSSLESSGGLTTDSSKGSKHSLTQDLEKCIRVLKVTLEKRYDDSETKKKLIKCIVQRLLNSKYRDDDTSTEFLSGLTFDSKRLGFKGNNTTTSTSDANNTDDSKEKRPRKSILRMDKFDSNIVASTSQSAPNLFTAVNAETINTNPKKIMTSYTESDDSSKGKTSSDNGLPKTSSEQLYLKYLEALKREESYKKHLRDKENFLRQKLGNSDTALKVQKSHEIKINNRLKDLVKDLTRNNYDDGSGDASKLEGGSTSDRNRNLLVGGSRNQRSHSIFTLSSSHSDSQKKPNLKKRMQVDRELDATTSKNHYCCCPHHYVDSKVAYADSSVQVNIKCQYQNDTDAKSYQHQSVKCTHCEESEYSQKSEECKCNKLKLSPRDIGTGCPKCGKVLKNTVLDSDTAITYQKYSRSPRNIAKMIPHKSYDIKDSICMCDDNAVTENNRVNNPIYRCSKLSHRSIRITDPSDELNTSARGSCKSSDEDGIQFLSVPAKNDLATCSSKSDSSKARKCSQSSQTHMSIKMSTNSTSKELICSEMRKDALIIHEATRCLQTEISINPQISDPTLSDIVIINNCGELILEGKREIPRCNSKGSDQRTFSDVYTSSESGGKFLTSTGHIFSKAEVKDSQINIVDYKNCYEPIRKTPSDYAIPIEGTNMTLVVSLGSKEMKCITDKIDEGTCTEKYPIADQGTCIAAECAKSAQCHASTTGNSTRSTAFSTEHQSNKNISSGRSSLRKSCISKTSPRTSPQRNTYPKECKSQGKKPFRRSNTGTGKLETCSGGCQEEPPNRIDVTDSLKKSSYKLKTSEYCSRVPDTCDNRNLRSGNVEESYTLKRREIGIQKDMPRFTPEMISKSVGSDVETLNISHVVKYQSDAHENFQNCLPKTTCKECGADNERNCTCKNFLDNNYKKSSCVECGSQSIRGCHCKSSKNGNSRETNCEVCGSGDLRGCSCGKAPKAECKNIERETCGCDIKDCQHKDMQECSPKKTKCTVCAFDICQCNGTQITPCISDIKTCGKCGSEEECQCDSDSNMIKDPIMDMIKDITRRYSKNEILKIRNKKCFTDIITVLNYLLETDESTDQEPRRVSTAPEIYDNCVRKSPSSDDKHIKTSQRSNSPLSKNTNICFRQSPRISPRCDNSAKLSMPPKPLICCDNTTKPIGTSESPSCQCKRGKSAHLFSKCANKDCIESSDMPCSTDLPSTSDSTACKILRKIRKECEKYHLRRNRCGRKCDISTSTSVNCDQCKKIHHCGCRHKCRRFKTVDKIQKKCVAYNLILQTSESMLSETTIRDNSRPLKNIVLKVPKSKDNFRAEMCQETVCNTEKGKGRKHCNPCSPRSKSYPCKESELSSTDEFIRRTHHHTVRDYLEKNRPDFVVNCSERQNCLKYMNQRRANERASNRDLLSLHAHREPDLTHLSAEQLRQLAKEIGLDMRQKKTAAKFISERDMKKHSKNIYKTLPEVVQKKEEKKKENVKKTNLLMASLFKKNLQKNTLRGSVNISNYNSVIKI